ncbi:hypothetical protein FS749_006487, partial [Ceratobasidium sp. UAMH 11750]
MPKITSAASGSDPHPTSPGATSAPRQHIKSANTLKRNQAMSQTEDEMVGPPVEQYVVFSLGISDAGRPCKACLRTHAAAVGNLVKQGLPLDSIQPDCVYDGDEDESPTNPAASQAQPGAQPHASTSRGLFPPPATQTVPLFTPPPQLGVSDHPPAQLPSLFESAGIGLDQNVAALLGDNPGILHQNNMTMASMMNMPNVDPYVPGLDPTYSVGNIGPAPEITAMLPYSWPEELPEPYTMTHLVRTFFASHAMAPHLLPRPSFLTRLTFPPTHAAFPSPALLHAIAAVGSLYAPQPGAPLDFDSGPIVGSVFRPREEIEKLKRLRSHLAAAGNSSTYAAFSGRGGGSSRGRSGGPPGGGRLGNLSGIGMDEMSFGDRHAALCFAKVLDDARTGRRLLEGVQGLIVLTWWMTANARWSEAWSVTGMIMRYCIPIGLTACASFDDHITGGPGVPGMAGMDSPSVSEVSPHLSSPGVGSPGGSLNASLAQEKATTSGSTDGAFNIDELSFNADGSLDFGPPITYNADVGAGLASGSGATPSTSATPDWLKDPSAYTEMNPSAGKSPAMNTPGPVPYSPEDQPKPQPPRRGRGRAGNWKSETILRPTQDVVEAEVRRRTFWHAYLLDRQQGSGTAWPMAIDDLDVGQDWPMTLAFFENGEEPNG